MAPGSSHCCCRLLPERGGPPSAPSCALASQRPGAAPAHKLRQWQPASCCRWTRCLFCPPWTGTPSPSTWAPSCRCRRRPPAATPPAPAWRRRRRLPLRAPGQAWSQAGASALLALGYLTVCCRCVLLMGSARRQQADWTCLPLCGCPARCGLTCGTPPASAGQLVDCGLGNASCPGLIAGRGICLMQRHSDFSQLFCEQRCWRHTRQRLAADTAPAAVRPHAILPAALHSDGPAPHANLATSKAGLHFEAARCCLR
jgi:hypothetical protein